MDANVNDTCKLNENVIEMSNRNQTLTNCLDKSDRNRGDNCIDCLDAFSSMSSQFKQLGSSSRGVCFEAVDLVKDILHLQNGAN